MSRVTAWILASAVAPTLLAAVACGSGGNPAPTGTATIASKPTASGLPLLTPPFSSSFQPSAPPPAPTLAALASNIDFRHPSGRVQWEGPDDRVSSEGEYHCGADAALKAAFHLPDVIVVKYAIDVFGFRAPTLVATQSNFAWTGYHHGDWQLWRTDDSSVLYLIDSSRPDVAFKYHNLGCK